MDLQVKAFSSRRSEIDVCDSQELVKRQLVFSEGWFFVLAFRNRRDSWNITFSRYLFIYAYKLKFSIFVSLIFTEFSPSRKTLFVDSICLIFLNDDCLQWMATTLESHSQQVLKGRCTQEQLTWWMTAVTLVLETKVYCNSCKHHPEQSISYQRVYSTYA